MAKLRKIQHAWPNSTASDANTSTSAYNLSNTENTSNNQWTWNRIYYDSTEYDVVAGVYFEAVFKIANATATGYAALLDVAGNVITGSEVTTSSTTTVIVKSSDVSGAISSGIHKGLVKTSNASYACTMYGWRLIIEQNGTIAATSTRYDVLVGNGTVPTTYGNFASNNFPAYYRYTSANFDGTVNIYLEGIMVTPSGTLYASVYDSAGNAVASSEISSTSTTDYRALSSAITLTNGTDYTVRVKSNSAVTTNRQGRFFIVVKQTGTITKTECVIPLGAHSRTGSTYTARGYLYDWQSGDFDTTNTYDFRTTQISNNTGYTAYVKESNIGGTELTTTSTVIAYAEATGVTMPANGTDLGIECKSNNASGNSQARAAYILVKASFSGATNVTVNAGVQTVTSSQPTATVTAIKNVTVSAGVQATTSSVVSPTVTAIQNVSISADVQSITSVLNNPTVTAIGNVSNSPDVLALTFTQNNVTVTAIQNITVSVNVQDLTPSLPSPSITAQDNVTTNPSAQSLLFTQNNPIVTAIKNVSISADVQSLTLSQQNPTVIVSDGISADVLTLTFSQLNPTVSVETNTVVSVGVQTLTFSQPTISVDDGRLGSYFIAIKVSGGIYKQIA